MQEYKPADNYKKLLEKWLKRSRESQLGHYLMAEILAKRHMRLGVCTIAITSISGATSIFSTLSEIQEAALGIASLLAAFLAALQTFFKYEEKSNQHLIAATNYSKARRKLEIQYTAEDEDRKILEEVRAELDSLAESSPNVPQKIFIKAIAQEG